MNKLGNWSIDLALSENGWYGKFFTVDVFFVIVKLCSH